MVGCLLQSSCSFSIGVEEIIKIILVLCQGNTKSVTLIVRATAYHFLNLDYILVSRKEQSDRTCGNSILIEIYRCAGSEVHCIIP